MEKTLAGLFQHLKLDIEDVSSAHAGHSGARVEGETHYKITIVSPRFSGKTRLERHRMVTETLKQEFLQGLHALQLVLKTPEEI
jgi:BolA protein